jgi:hypothetical protein
MLFLSVVSQAQNFTATYAYDANGNRKKVTVIYLSEKDQIVLADTNLILPDTTLLPDNGWNKKITEPLDDLVITIYPNPTHGMLCVKISGASTEQLSAAGNAIKLWDMQSKLLYNIAPLTQYNFVNLSRNTMGTYILKVFVAGRTKEYRIVKN